MSNVIQFLETIGRSPVSAREYAASVNALDVDAAQQQALMHRDHAALNALLGGRTKLFCSVLAEEDQEFAH